MRKKSLVNKYMNQLIFLVRLCENCKTELVKNLREALTYKQEQISEGMGKLKNKTKQLGNEIKNTQNVFKDEYKRVNEDMAKLQNN